MVEILITILKTLFTKGVTILWENKNNLSLYMKTLFWNYRNKEIRFSISYLFRIKIPNTNSYLLVLNRRIDNQLQPVGGVYKRYGDDKLFEKWDYMPDNKRNGLDVDDKSFSDLRFKVKGKHVIDVIKWFEEGKEREISAEREFFEELIKPKILDAQIFSQIKYKHLKRISKNLKWSEHFSCYEVLIYDIMELLPTEQQNEELKNLSRDTDLNKGYAIVDFDDIEQLRLVRDGKQIARIGEHTKLTINKN